MRTITPEDARKKAIARLQKVMRKVRDPERRRDLQARIQYLHNYHDERLAN